MEHLRRPLDLMTMDLFLAASVLHPDDNIVVCPFACINVLTMLKAASRGTSASKQIENVLKYADLIDGRADKTTILQIFRRTFRALTKSSKLEGSNGCTMSDREFQLIISTRVYIQRDVEVDPDFLENCKKYLKLEFFPVSFQHKAAIRNQIERWLQDKAKDTGSFNPAVVPEDMIDPEYHGPRMVIAASAHFRAGWVSPFDPTLTTKAEFHVGHNKFEVDMMSITEHFPYYEDDSKGLKILEIPYYENEVTLVLTLPTKRGGLAELQRSLTQEMYTTAQMQKRMRVVKVALPKVQIRCTYDLRKLLKHIGIKQVFEDDMPLTEMTLENPFRPEAIHTSAFELDEEGTFVKQRMDVDSDEGSCDSDYQSSTSADSDERLSPVKDSTQIDSSEDAYEFIADQPFWFGLRQNRTGCFLFSGRMLHP